MDAALPACSSGAREYSPCELTFEINDADIPKGKTPYTASLLNVEFRSPRAKTYLLPSFWDGDHTLRVRFTPTESGTWTYRSSGDLARFNNQESTFAVAATEAPGFVISANLRHWATEKQAPARAPHLWMSASVPAIDLDQTAFQTWVDARQKDGFTHIKTSILQAKTKGLAPFKSASEPNFDYFRTLDERLLYAQSKGMTLDLVLAGHTFSLVDQCPSWEERQRLLRFVVARYAALNLTWQLLEYYEDVAGSRSLQKEVGPFLRRLDPYNHPISTGAHATSSPLLVDRWMTFLIDSSPHLEVGAVDRQTTTVPMVHLVTATEPVAFRKEVWNSTMNGSYPTISYEASLQPANAQVMSNWFKLMSTTRHWELEPYFDVDGGRAIGLDEVEFLVYLEKSANLEVTLMKHKYNARWFNPLTGEQIALKDYKGESFTGTPPDSTHDWVLQLSRDGRKEGMLRSFKFASYQEPPVQDIETNAAKIPFEIMQPEGTEIQTSQPVKFEARVKRQTRATRTMLYVWTGEVVVDGEGVRVLATGPDGTFLFPKELVKQWPAALNLRLTALNANGKAYSIDHVYRLLQ